MVGLLLVHTEYSSAQVLILIKEHPNSCRTVQYNSRIKSVTRKALFRKAQIQPFEGTSTEFACQDLGLSIVLTGSATDQTPPFGYCYKFSNLFLPSCTSGCMANTAHPASGWCYRGTADYVVL